VLGEGDVGIVLAHQAFSDLCLWLPFGLELSGQGFRVLLFDFRNHGLAQSVVGSRDGQVDLDVVEAAAELRRRGARKVVLVGASLGGAAVVRGAVSTRPVVSAVVGISPPDTKLLTGFPTYQPLDPTAAAARLRVPLLIIAGRSDLAVPVASSIRIFKASPSKKKRLVVVASPAHGAGLLGGSSPSAEKARNALLEYIRLHTGS